METPHKGDVSQQILVGEVGEPGALSMPLSSYWELMAATEKYLQLLKETSKGYLNADEFAMSEAVIYSQGLTLGGLPVSLRIGSKEVTLSSTAGQHTLPLSELKRAEYKAKGVLLESEGGLMEIGCSIDIVGAGVVKSIKMRRDAIKVTPGGSSGGRLSPSLGVERAAVSPPPPSPLPPPPASLSQTNGKYSEGPMDFKPPLRATPAAPHPVVVPQTVPVTPKLENFAGKTQTQKNAQKNTQNTKPDLLSMDLSQSGVHVSPLPSFMGSTPSPMKKHVDNVALPVSTSFVPLTRSIRDVAELEGLALMVANLSPHGQNIGVDVVVPRVEATVVPIGATQSASPGRGEAVSLTTDIAYASGGSALPIMGIDPRPNRATKEHLELFWNDDNARLMLSWGNAAPYLVTVTADFASATNVVSLLPAVGTEYLGGASYRAVLLPGESFDFVQVTSTGTSAGVQLCAIVVTFSVLSVAQQLEYLMPLAEAAEEVPNFSLQKLVAQYGFSASSAAQYMARRLQNEAEVMKRVDAEEGEGGGLAALLTACGVQGVSYVDTDFIDVMSSESPKAVLKRPQHFLPVHREPAVMIGTPPCTEISCKRLGHKWWVSAARALAEHPDILQACFTDYDLPKGHFTARVCTSGWWMDITCDTWIPCDNEGPCFAKAASTELWIVLLEKVSAWLAGGYSNLAHGTVGRALALFTGAPFHRVAIEADSDLEDLWTQIISWSAQACLLVFTASGIEPLPDSSTHTASSYNLRAASLPSATILKTESFEGQRLVHLRGDSVHGVDWGWNDPIWGNAATKCLLNGDMETARKSGAFWMNIKDISRIYSGLTVCHLRRGWHDIRIHGETHGKHCDFVVELHPDTTTRTVLQLQPAAPGASPTFGLAVLRKHRDPHIAYEPVALVPAQGTPQAGEDDPPVAVELTLQEGVEYVLVPSRVDPTVEETQFVLSIHTESAEAGWAYLRKVSREEVGDILYAPLCRQGRGQDAKPLPNGRHGATAVWWRDDTDIECGMVLENASSSWTWRCEIDAESGPLRVSLPPRSKMHVFPNLQGDRRLQYDHFVSVYHTSTYLEAGGTVSGNSAEGPFSYAHNATLPTIERPVQKGSSSAIHAWHTVRL